MLTPKNSTTSAPGPSRRGGTFLALFERRVGRSGDRPALRTAGPSGDTDPLTWAEWGERSRDVAAGLIRRGVRPGDRVAILAPTRPEWVIADVGIMMAGAVSVPVHEALPAAQVAGVLAHSGARAVIAGGDGQVAKLLAQRADTPTVEWVFGLDPGDGAAAADWVRPWSELLAEGRLGRSNGTNAQLDRLRRDVRSDTLATITYTSGTTGEPKGVPLTHGNLAYEVSAVQGHLGLRPDDVQLLAMPLAHIFSRQLYAAFVGCGGLLVFARPDADVTRDLAEVKPTVFAYVPRFFEELHARVVSAAERAGGLQKALFGWACGVAEEVCDWHAADRPLRGVPRLRSVVARRVAGNRLRALLGGRVRLLISGGAPLAPSLARFFFGFGVEILEGYGLAETAGATHVNRPGEVRVGTVGVPLPGVVVRVAADGEILVRGPNVMRGYHGASSSGLFTGDGFFHTGDLGEVDEDGYLTITGRKKDNIVTADGRIIAPQPIERRLKMSPYVSEAMVHGDGRAFLSALITLHADNVLALVEELGLTMAHPGELAAHPEVYKLVESVVRDINSALPSYEAIRKFAVLDGDFALEAGELTPTKGIRRKGVASRHRELLDSFYTERY